MSKKRTVLIAPHVAGAGLFPETTIVRTWKDATTLEPVDVIVNSSEAESVIWFSVCSVLVSRICTLQKTVAFKAKNFFFGEKRYRALNRVAYLEVLVNRLRVGGLQVGDKGQFLAALLDAFHDVAIYTKNQKGEVPQAFKNTDAIIICALSKERPNKTYRKGTL